MKLKYVFIFMLFTTIAHAEIDCFPYQQTVNDLTAQINNAALALEKAQENLGQCQEINTVSISDEYKAAVEELSRIPVSSGVNWNDLGEIK